MTAPTPTCPRCGQRPALVIDGGHQSFCSNEDCAVLSWDQWLSVAELEASWQTVDLRSLASGDQPREREVPK